MRKRSKSRTQVAKSDDEGSGEVEARADNPKLKSGELDLSEASENIDADDFIAKFKKQLRLQRLEAIPRNKPKHESAEGDLSEEGVDRGVQICSGIIPSKSEASVKIGEEKVYHHGDKSCSSSSDPSIFRTPFPGLEFQEPQLASIGPYNKSKNLPLENYKYSFLDKFMSRTRNQGKDLCFFVRHMMTLEWRARRCYAEDMPMSSPEFVEMLLVDGCFIIEVLRHFGRSEESDHGVFPIEPWRIPILVQDLLMLENQIPFFVLGELFDLSESEGTATVSLPTMALKFFDLAFPRSMDFSYKTNHLEADHLLELFLQSIRPSISKRVQLEQQCYPPPPVHLIKSVMALRTSGIELRTRRADRFTDVNFKNGALTIPPVTINDLFITILNNCVAFEQRSKRNSKDLTAYVSFMCSLIRQPKDVELLCSNGIISRFSHNDKKVADSFHSLWLNVCDVDTQDSYLSKTLMETERYYTSEVNGRTRCLWRHFLRYWRIILFCITNFMFGFNLLRSVIKLRTHFVKVVKFLGDNICVLSQGLICFFFDPVFLKFRLRPNTESGLSKVFVFFFLNLITLMILVSSKPTSNFDKLDIEVECSPNKSEQSTSDGSGESCSYEMAAVDKKVIKIDHKGKAINKNEENYYCVLYMKKYSGYFTELTCWMLSCNLTLRAI
ncbi:UPF0481 protein At3g47200-like [Durio zibethinus]|uniref:UPF0481 protein At3g47200-like n=1 Tax=Durio zibethinus TaxID=66656 RepID=A0A6P5Y2J7_DURZI|nr:UPF0481 protein At3g47200-like [Durio zibethinus]